MSTAARRRGHGRSLTWVDPLGRPDERCASARNPPTFPCPICSRVALTPADVRRGRICANCQAAGGHDYRRPNVVHDARHLAVETGLEALVTYDPDGQYHVRPVRPDSAFLGGVGEMDVLIVQPNGRPRPVGVPGPLPARKFQCSVWLEGDQQPRLLIWSEGAIDGDPKASWLLSAHADDMTGYAVGPPGRQTWVDHHWDPSSVAWLIRRLFVRVDCWTGDVSPFRPGSAR